jgi:hypothetical protein
MRLWGSVAQATWTNFFAETKSGPFNSTSTFNELSRPEKPGFFLGKKKPAMEIAGMCLPLKPQKERVIPAQQSLRKFFLKHQPGTGVQWISRIQHLKKMAVSVIYGKLN